MSNQPIGSTTNFTVSQINQPNYEIVANCIAVIAKEYRLDDKATQSLARIIKATVDTYKPNITSDKTEV